MVVVWALVASFVIGFADFAGAKASTKRSALAVTFHAQLINAILIPIVVLVAGWSNLHNGDLLIGAIGGAAAGAGYLAFFHGMAHGRISVIAPLTAVVTAFVPVIVDVIQGVHLSAWRWVGVAIALVAIPLLAYRSSSSGAVADDRMSLPAELLYGLGGGALFSVFFVVMGHTSSDSGQWPLVMSALAGTVTAGIACAIGREPVGRPPALAVVNGVLQAVASLAILRALQLGPISVATVLGSLYPLVTTALAVRIDHERVERPNALGVVLAVGGACVVAATR